MDDTTLWVPGPRRHWRHRWSRWRLTPEGNYQQRVCLRCDKVQEELL